MGKILSTLKVMAVLLLIVSVVIGCGTGGIDTSTPPSPSSSSSPSSTTPSSVPATIDLLVGSTQLNSDGASTVKLTALVKDTANRAMEDQAVEFTADSGLLVVTNGITDSNGTATATLGTGGNPINRPIVVTAATGSKRASNTVNVLGTTIDISGLNSLSLSDSTPLTVFLKDSAGIGIPGKTLTISSERGNTLNSSSYVTNANGQITVEVTATMPGLDTISASFTNIQKDFTLTVDPNSFLISAAQKEIDIGPAGSSITIEYKIGGVAVPGTTINFATTRGTLNNSTAVTGADGKATISVSSTNSGPGLISAFVAGGPSAQLAIEFVATTADKLSLQANPSSIGTNSPGLTAEKSLITAIVRDANNNLVKNKTIRFTILSDSSGGSLSPGSATTDGSGIANTYFIGGTTPGAKDGVTILATVVDTPTITATTNLTVAHKAMFISVATGPTVEKIEPNKYRQNYVALVVDTAGNPIQNANVSATVTPNYFRKGYYVWSGTVWVLVPTLEASFTTFPAVPACGNEDALIHDPRYDYNGVLDPLEDVNLNGRLDPGNVASVTASPTDENGFSTVTITYARDYAAWVNVRLEVNASTTGDTASAFADFNLAGVGDDYSKETAQPPGYISPFGTSSTCFDTRPDAPQGLTASSDSATQARLAWQQTERAAGYKIYRTDTGFLKSTGELAVTDTGLTPGTQYCYSLIAYDSTGNDSAPSGQVCVTTSSLSAPTGLTITAFSTSQINLAWTASTGAASYRIYRAGTYLKSANVTTAADTGLLADTQYCYAVSAIDASGQESALTSGLCASTPPVAAPTNPLVTAISSTRIDLSWDVVAGVSGYKIYRSGINLKSARNPDDPAATRASASDTGLLADTEYCYSISAYDAANNESSETVSLCATTYGPPPADPGNVSTYVETPTTVILNWSASAGAVEYYVYRNGVKIDTSLSPVRGTTYTDTGAAANAQNIYRVTAIDGTGSESSGLQNQVTVNTALTVPAMAYARADSSSQITIGWLNAGAGTQVAGYNIYRNGNISDAVPSAATLQYSDKNLLANTEYCYRVSATDALGNESAQSSVSLCATTEAPPTAAHIDLLVSSTQLNSDGISPVDVTALVRDANNRAMANQKVDFKVDSVPAGAPLDAGFLTVINAETNASGQAKATLGTGGNQKNRSVVVTASIGSLSATKTIAILGTTITVSGQTTTVTQNGTVKLTVYLKDSSGKGIPNQAINLSSVLGNTLTPATVTADASGQATATFTATTQGNDQIIATSAAMNANNSASAFAISVSPNPNAESLTFTAPNSGNELAINGVHNVTVHYSNNNGPISGAIVNYYTTRGSFSSSSIPTDGNGNAAVTVTSSVPGQAVLTAAVSGGGPTESLPIEFVATTPAKINVQADPAIIGINLSGSTTQKSTIVAVVRDADNHLVKNKKVIFNITRGAGGTLDSPFAVTDSFGTASVQYIAGPTSSAQNGIAISATVEGTAIAAETTLTVAQTQLFLTVGSGNVINVSSNPNYYNLDLGVLVTDAGGNPIQGVKVTATQVPVVYLKGFYSWVWDTATTGHWDQNLTLTTSNHPLPPVGNTPYPWPGSPANSCANEDLTYYNDPSNVEFLKDGSLEPGEDFNNNGILDPGGIAAITPTATTDANGVGSLTLSYARNYATWTMIRVDVKVIVGGTEGAATTTFTLPGLRSDYTSFDLAPPGSTSPFGQSANCNDIQ